MASLSMLAFHVNIYSMSMLTGIRRSNKKAQELTFNSIINLFNILLFLDNSRFNYTLVRIKEESSLLWKINDDEEEEEIRGNYWQVNEYILIITQCFFVDNHLEDWVKEEN